MAGIEATLWPLSPKTMCERVDLVEGVSHLQTWVQAALSVEPEKEPSGIENSMSKFKKNQPDITENFVHIEW